MIGIPEDVSKALKAFRVFSGMDPSALVSQAQQPAPTLKGVEQGILHLVILLESLEVRQSREIITAAIDALGNGYSFFDPDALLKQYRRVKEIC